MDFSVLLPFVIEKLGDTSFPLVQMSTATIQECGKLIAQKLFQRFPDKLSPQTSTEDDLKDVIEAEIQNPFQKDYWDGMLDVIKLIAEKENSSQNNSSGKNQYIQQGNSFDGAHFSGGSFNWEIGKK